MRVLRAWRMRRLRCSRLQGERDLLRGQRAAPRASLARGQPAREQQMLRVPAGLLVRRVPHGLPLRVVRQYGAYTYTSLTPHPTTCSLCTPYIVTDRALVPQCHAGCRALIQDDCNFGMLQPIFLPPSAVSIPRTEVPMEAIIGVHVRPPPSQRDFGCRKCPTNSGPGKHRFPPRTCATQFAASFLSIGLACKVVGRFALSWSQAHTVTDLLLQDAEDQHRNFLPNYFLL